MTDNSKVKNLNRRKSRILSLQIIYAWHFSKIDYREMMSYMDQGNFDEELDTIVDGMNLDSEASSGKRSKNNDNMAVIRDYSLRLIESTIIHSRKIDNYILKKLKNWDLDRISIIDKIILRLALNEMLFFDDIPPKVSIVEGVEIAKVFGTDESSGFINGVLDSIYNDLIKDKIEVQ